MASNRKYQRLQRKKQLLTYATAASVALAAGLGLEAGRALAEVDPDQMVSAESFDLPLGRPRLRPPMNAGTVSGPTTTISWGTFLIDFDGDANPEFGLGHIMNTVFLSALSSGGDRGLSVFGSGTIMPMPRANPIPISGATINTTTPGFQNISMTMGVLTVSFPGGQWYPLGGAPAYLGLRFNLAEDPGNNPHVGWIRLALTPSGMGAGAINFIISPDPPVGPPTNAYGAYGASFIRTGYSAPEINPPTAVTLAEVEASSGGAFQLRALGAAGLAALAGALAAFRHQITRRLRRGE